MADWKDILSDNAEPLSDEELLQYLDNAIPEEEKHAIEKKLADGSFESDALDGLAQLKSTDAVKRNVSQLNKKLQQQLQDKKQRQQKRKFKEMEWIVFAILILLLICVIGYAVIRISN